MRRWLIVPALLIPTAGLGHGFGLGGRACALLDLAATFAAGLAALLWAWLPDGPAEAEAAPSELAEAEGAAELAALLDRAPAVEHGPRVAIPFRAPSLRVVYGPDDPASAGENRPGGILPLPAGRPSADRPAVASLRLDG